jgi:hypothetical protein
MQRLNTLTMFSKHAPSKCFSYIASLYRTEVGHQMTTTCVYASMFLQGAGNDSVAFIRPETRIRARPQSVQHQMLEPQERKDHYGAAFEHQSQHSVIRHTRSQATRLGKGILLS